MTREEAIRVLEEFQVIDDWTIVHLPPMEDAVNMAIEALQAKTDGDTISRQAALDLIGYDIDETYVEIESLPSVEPKTEDNTNANEIYNYLKEQIGDTVDDMKEFDAWFERMVWHVRECDRLTRLTAEPKTGEWIWKDRHINRIRLVNGLTVSNEEVVIRVHEDYIEQRPYCSECGKWNDSDFLSYCPNCGAKMRGLEE